MASGFRGSSRCASGAPMGPGPPWGFGPASFSSSKMEDEARSPRTRGPCAGFFRRNSSVKVFFGAAALCSGVFLPNHHNVRRWVHGMRKVYGIWEDATVARDQLAFWILMEVFRYVPGLNTRRDGRCRLIAQ